MDFDDPPADPVVHLLTWLEDAKGIGLPNPNAMTLATIGTDGRPAARIVLLKSLDSRGAVFYTNRLSRKGRALASNAHAALLFHWDALDRQVRIEGDATVVSEAESDAYFASRPRLSQIAAWASTQSEPIESRNALEEKARQIEQQFAGRDVSRPPHWGGNRVSLQAIEFWQGHPFRLHDRVVYQSDSKQGWTITRLQP